ncbi:MAG: hypothetical protein J5857_02910 [Treponema sp.]|nr:hypothetical protein [Treponema sp.]
MKRSIFLFAFLFLIAGAVSAQSADRVTEILGEKQVTYGEIAYLAGSELNLVQEKTSYADALKIAVEAGIIKGNPEATDPISYAGLAFACSKTWNVSKSLFYKLSNSPRYAFKQLQSLGIIPSNADPSQTVSGRNALNIITACIEKFDAEGGKE